MSSSFTRILWAIAAFAAGGLLIAQTGSDHSVESYLIHVSTDKPIYRIGEKVFVRGVVLSANSHSPVPAIAGGNRNASFEIKGPRGDTVASGVSPVVDSVVGFTWQIPAGQPGGEYTVRISHPSSDLPAERKFDIRAYRAPRLKSQIVFVRDGYGPGDTVSANLHVERAEGGIPAGAKVSVSARLDGAEIWTGATRVDSSGNAGANFKLPAAIARGEGALAMIVEDGGAVETATKTIPILLQTVDLAIYPEGGDLIAGLPNRVYIEGRTPAKKPADMAGVVVDAAGHQVAAFRTEHEGRGRFSFVPSRGKAYSLCITEPSGIKTVFPLPAVRESGVVISSASDITPRRKDVVVRVAATQAGEYGVELSQRGKEISFKSITLGANEISTVAFTVPRAVDGVIVATVFDDQKKPIAERLVFRQPEHRLNVQITADHTDYVPGDKVSLRISTTDETGKPVEAMVGVTATDSSILEMIDKREQAPRLPVMVLLEHEVKDLADAHVYLDETNSKAPVAMDLLLGTQGWRRFAFAGSGALSGVVTDFSSALIPGVTIEARNTLTAVVARAVTNGNGKYTFALLPSGTYRVSASMPGFQAQMMGVQIKDRSPVRQDFRLPVAAAMQMVAVAADGIGVGGRAGGPGAAPPPFAAPPRGQQGQQGQLARGGVLSGVLGGVMRAAKADDNILVNDLQVNAEIAPPPLEKKQLAVRINPGNIVTVREYAHALAPDWTEGSRTDFSETVYWNAGIKTDGRTGIATVSFNLSDSVTSFRVLADAFSPDGMLGAGTAHIESVQPFSIDPKIPLQVTSGDVIQLPVSIINGVNRELRDARLTPKGPDGIHFTMPGGDSIILGPKERSRRLVQLEVGREFSGLANLAFDANAGAYRDSVTRTLDVQSPGFPRETTTGGILERNGTRTFEFTIPEDAVRGSLSSSVTVYPSPLASMTDALQSLLQQPFGCFEQTSSTSYPMVMAQQYFLTHTGVDPAIIGKAKDLLEVSYKRLTGFESPTRGYEWFGGDPGHEALTAYGLMQFTDMAQVRSVDKDMLDRTRAWLLSRRDGKGEFSLSSKALDTFGRAPVETTDAYIVWALIESGEKPAGLTKEIAAVKASAQSTQDSYILALAANILHETGDSAGARELMDKLVKSQEPAGDVKGAVTSITRSGGDALAIETTALSVLAWMHEQAYAEHVEQGMRWIIQSNKIGRFGSTQSTVLALRSILAYDNAHARPKAPGRIVLTLDGKPVGAPVDFTADTKGALTFPEFTDDLGTGKHIVALKMENGSDMPFAAGIKYHSLLPESSDQSKIGIKVTLTDSRIQEGTVTEAAVSIANKSAEAIPSPVAIVGLPGGLEVRHDQLKELVRSGKIDAYEVIGREVVLYWRFLKANGNVELPLSLVAATPGSFTGPASRAYLYYTDEYKNWAPGVKVTVVPR